MSLRSFNYLFIATTEHTMDGNSDYKHSGKDSSKNSCHKLRGYLKMEGTLRMVISTEKVTLLCRKKPLLERNFPCLIGMEKLSA